MELKNAVALSSSSFSIIAKDSFGNSKSLGVSHLFNISMKKVDEQLHITPFILDQNNSVYIAFYTPTVAGIYSMSVTFGFAVEKMHVQKSPFAFEVRFSPTPRVVSCKFSRWWYIGCH